MRTDKDPKEIKKEKAENEASSQLSENEAEKMMEGKGNSVIIGGIKIMNPDKVIYDVPLITKADVVRYYEKVSKRMLPYVNHRI